MASAPWHPYAMAAAGALLLACGSTPPPTTPMVVAIRTVDPSGAQGTAAASAGNSRGGRPWSPGDSVEVKWQERWWPAVVIEPRDGLWLIHFEGYGTEWDEAVAEDRIRERSAEIPPPDGASLDGPPP